DDLRRGHAREPDGDPGVPLGSRLDRALDRRHGSGPPRRREGGGPVTGERLAAGLRGARSVVSGAPDPREPWRPPPPGQAPAQGWGSAPGAGWRPGGSAPTAPAAAPAPVPALDAIAASGFAAQPQQQPAQPSGSGAWGAPAPGWTGPTSTAPAAPTGPRAG